MLNTDAVSEKLSIALGKPTIISVGKVVYNNDTYQPFYQLYISHPEPQPRLLKTQWNPEIEHDLLYHATAMHMMGIKDAKSFTEQEIHDEIVKIYVQAILTELQIQAGL